MNVGRLLIILGLAAPLFAQLPGALPPRPLQTKLSAGPRSAQVARGPQIRGAQNFSILPQVVDGGIWSTEIVICNLDPSAAESYEVDFFDESGKPATVNFVGVGPQSQLSGNLQPGQTVFFVTADTAPSVQTTWGSINNSGSGQLVSSYEVIRLTIPAQSYFAETQVASSFGIDNTNANPGAFMPFDNTSGAVTSVAAVNPDLTSFYGGTNTVDVYVLDANGHQVGLHQLTLAPGQHTAFEVLQEYPETVGISGTLYVVPHNDTFSPVTLLGLRGYTNGKYITLSTVSILQPSL